MLPASAEREAMIRGPFAITPSVPVLVAPGDEFEAGVTVANNLDSETEIDLRAEVSANLSLVGAVTQQLCIAAGREQTAVFKFRVTDELGSGEIKFSARGNNEESRRRATVSIRPPVPYMTDVRSGNFNGACIDVPITRTLHSEFRQLEASVAALPLGFAHGLDVYLKNFPYGCSEQITSAAFCRLLLADEVDFGLKRAEVNAQLEKTFIILRRRQNDQGRVWLLGAGRKIGNQFRFRLRDGFSERGQSGWISAFVGNVHHRPAQFANDGRTRAGRPFPMREHWPTPSTPHPRRRCYD